MPKKADNGKGEEVFLIDGNSLAYRAFFALPGVDRDRRRAADERDLRVRLDDGQDPHRPLAEGGDRRLGQGLVGAREGLRRVQVAAQVAPRPAQGAVAALAPLAEAFGFKNVSVEGYEADDVIATLARQASTPGCR